MKAIRRFTVSTVLPEALAPLDELSTNLRWTWHEPTRRLFESIDPRRWEDCRYDPIALLGLVGPERLAELAADDSFVASADAALADLHEYLEQPRWYQSLADPPPAIAYFSPEFGIAAALPQYSGGLGILAGDHLKAASDLGVPILGVGLFYRSGYFRQAISREGWQIESYPVLDPDGLPITVLRHPDGTAAQVALALPDGTALYARIWRVKVGRVTLLLLDTDVQENEEQLRGVTDRLYGGGGEHRLLQELLLGIGGVRAVKIFTALTGAPVPAVFHTNEGHAGFLGLERVSDLIGEGLTFAEALQVVRAGTVFTTHTPVPAGHRPLRVDARGPLLLRRPAARCRGGRRARARRRAVRRRRPDELQHGGDGLAPRPARQRRLEAARRRQAADVRRALAGLRRGRRADHLDHQRRARAHLDRSRARRPRRRTFGSSDTTVVDWASHAVSDAELWAVRQHLRAQLVEDARRRVGSPGSRRTPASGRRRGSGSCSTRTSSPSASPAACRPTSG